VVTLLQHRRCVGSPKPALLEQVEEQGRQVGRGGLSVHPPRVAGLAPQRHRPGQAVRRRCIAFKIRAVKTQDDAPAPPKPDPTTAREAALRTVSFPYEHGGLAEEEETIAEVLSEGATPRRSPHRG
jgi:hypothetical protein